MRKFIKAVSEYFLFFFIIGFVITCCTMLFVTTLSNETGVVLNSENLNLAAKLTFVNVLLLSMIFYIIDRIRRKWTVELPAKRITNAADQIMQGDFNIRIKQQNKFATDSEWNEVIACFNRMVEELGSVETLRTDFIANVSHEMKTPLAVMQNYGTLLQTPNISEEKRLEYAKGITDASKRLDDLMTNILRLNRLENQQIYQEITEYNLGEQICECLLQYENVWEKEGIEIETNIEEDVIVCTDRELLSLVWNNLFSNAFKFTESGGKVSVILKTNDQHAIVEVKDTGCGMSREIGSHIFEKFYQGDTSRAVQGNGLGLALVKRVVDIVQGEIEVESMLEKGSTFTVKIRRIHTDSRNRSGSQCHSN